jgi:hypothetical protein
MGIDPVHDEGIIANHSGKANELFIAGSRLPHYYMESSHAIGALLLSDLERISTLREKGFLSEEEFDLCKQKLFRKVKH